MYTAHFGLHSLPFEDRADSKFFFASKQHEEAVAAMQYEVQHGSGLGLVLGEAGTGKTMVLRTLLGRVGGAEKTVIVTAPASGGFDLLRETCKGFGISLPATLGDARGVARLRRHLARTVREGRQPVLFVDRAEHLSPADLADLEMLLELQDGQKQLLRVVVAGHPRFGDLLGQPAFARLRQLAFTECTLTGLQEDEVKTYIEHRLQIAGATSPIFGERATLQIHVRSGGVPRVINQLCNAAMLAAYGAGENIISSILESDEPIATDVPSESLSGAILESQPHWQNECESLAAGRSYQQSTMDRLLKQAESTAADLERRVQAADSARKITMRLEHLLTEVRRESQLMESRLSHHTRQTEEMVLRLEKGRQAAAKAAHIEKRLEAFGEQLSRQIDDVEARVSKIMLIAAPLDDARMRLEQALQDATRIRSDITVAVEQCKTRLSEEARAAEKEFERSFEAGKTSVIKSVQAQMDQMESRAAQRCASHATRLEKDIEQKSVGLTEFLEEAENKSRLIAQGLSQKYAELEQELQRAADSTVELNKSVEDADRKASELKKLEKRADEAVSELKITVDQGSQSAQTVRDEVDKLRAIQLETAQSAARISAEIGTAQKAGDVLETLTVAAQQKTTQLASLQAALSHTQERMTRILANGISLAERCDSLVTGLENLIPAGEKLHTDIVTRTQHASQSIEQLNAGTARSGEARALLAEVATEAAGVEKKLEATRSLATKDILALQNQLATASQSLEKLARLESVAADADQHTKTLQLLVDAASIHSSELPSLIEQAGACSGELQAQSRSVIGIIDQTQRTAGESKQRLDQHLSELREAVETSQDQFSEFRGQVKDLERRLEQVSGQACASEERASRVHQIVESAQTQSENLERVCVAVRKVFAGLSQATLSAQSQTQELEQFVQQAGQTATSLQAWLRKISSRLEEAGLEAPGRIPVLAHAQSNTAEAGVIQRQASVSIEDEPGAEPAHLIDSCLDGSLGEEQRPAVREISDLIRKARRGHSQTQTPNEMVESARSVN